MPEIDEARLRAKYRTRQDGSYCIRTIAPRGYAIPMDGPVGGLMRQTDISHFRPAHVHFLIDEPGHRKLITHLFQAGSDYLDSDVVFGTKDALIIPFTERPAEYHARRQHPRNALPPRPVRLRPPAPLTLRRRTAAAQPQHRTSPGPTNSTAEPPP
ncbi:hypothetical protein ACRAWF_01380 [Streptomyces sp. L7]